MALNKDLNTSGGEGSLQGNSSLYRQGTTPNTRAATSQKVRLLAPQYGSKSRGRMGVVSSFSYSESRGVDPLRGIGMGDIVAELVPGVTEPGSISIERALLYLANLWQATGYAGGVDGPVRSLKHHKWPFDIESQMVFSTLVDNDLGEPNRGVAGTGFQGGLKQARFTPQATTDPAGNFAEDAGHSALITMYETCWWQDFSYSLGADQGMIMESGSCTCTDVHDLNTVYGEFLSTGNDPSIGQYASVSYARGGSTF